MSADDATHSVADLTARAREIAATLSPRQRGTLERLVRVKRALDNGRPPGWPGYVRTLDALERRGLVTRGTDRQASLGVSRVLTDLGRAVAAVLAEGGK